MHVLAMIRRQPTQLRSPLALLARQRRKDKGVVGIIVMGPMYKIAMYQKVVASPPSHVVWSFGSLRVGCCSLVGTYLGLGLYMV